MLFNGVSMVVLKWLVFFNMVLIMLVVVLVKFRWVNSDFILRMLCRVKWILESGVV